MVDMIQKAADHLRQSAYAIALTGAGMSTESGIPDFRGPSGIWTKNPEAEQKAYQRYELFRENPVAYWEERLGGPSLLGDLDKIAPNPGHYALAELERKGYLKTVITQNIDNLHQRAGSRHVLDYHGNGSRLRCASCQARYEKAEYDLARLRREGRLPPLCRECGGVVKADTVHFGEPIPPDVAGRSVGEVEKCDLMLICGTSAVVYPFAHLPVLLRQRRAGAKAIIVEINAEPTPLTKGGISDYLIQGKTGQILPRLVDALKATQAAPKEGL
jgi:NAD-dependent deacetylase